MIVEYPIGGQPVRVDSNLSKRELDRLILQHCPGDMPPHREGEKRYNFNGHLITWRRVMRDRKRVYAVEILAYDLRMNRLVLHPKSDGCKDYNDACAVVRGEIKAAQPVK